MPSRIKVAREPIVAMVNEVGDEAEAARRLGLHYNTVHQIMRLQRGLCIACGKKKVRPGFTKCHGCADHEKNRQANKRKDALKSGKCSMCTKPLCETSNMYCDEHRRQARTRRRRHSLAKFGPEVFDVWLEAGGRCQVCGKPEDQQRTHMHHIDGDHGNRDRSNFVVLCLDCHYTVHQLLNSRNRVALIAWYERTYRDKPLR